MSDKGKELIRKLVEKLRGESPLSERRETGSAVRVMQVVPVRSKPVVKKPVKKQVKKAAKKAPVKKPVKKLAKKLQKKAKPVKKQVKKSVKAKKKK